MARIAVVCPAFFSHLRAFEALGEQLETLGHHVVFLLPEGTEPMVHKPGFEVAGVPLPPGYDPEATIRRAARPRGLPGILRTVGDSAAVTDALCRHGPAILRERGIDAIVADELEPAGGLLARHLRLPFASMAAALPIERDPSMPLPFLGWSYDPTERGLARNRGGELVGGLLLGRQRRVIRRWAQHFQLAEIRDDRDCLSDRLRLAQTVASFDFPRPADTLLRPVGPIRSTTPSPGQAFGAPRQCDRPFVFASLGTLQGHRFELFRLIAAACRDLGAELLIAHCGGLDPAQAARLDADHVVDFADQMAALRQADICITHGGLNTVLDALATRTPMLALPIAFDQPGVGARIRHHRVGETLPAGRATRAGIRTRLERLLAEHDGFVAAAAPMRGDIARANGARNAAVLIDALVARRSDAVSVPGLAAAPPVGITPHGAALG
ncbi:glycosyltransferase [Aureimonas jatrophae]|uniref:Zeaxanthin glucosyltransferase n=1 Tax=Aureimonas jatrophae TaxID=1166073 RepID=A0A1H0FDQ4_9HYPH|nr:glycosyltransferase [Aureimonas jatrophae]MBB3950066.1 zeaxanthin glucosyltransferase [Aureimonas jatrophae]SDN92744.1 zeaxanthin glucosyltransferase [Aureimonas jatrophae]